MMLYSGLPVFAFALLAELLAIAESLPEPWWQSIVQTGAIGGVLIWFMYWGQKILRENTAALNLLSRAISTMILHSKHQDAAISEYALEIQQLADEQLRKNEPKTASGRGR